MSLISILQLRLTECRNHRSNQCTNWWCEERQDDLRGGFILELIGYVLSETNESITKQILLHTYRKRLDG